MFIKIAYGPVLRVNMLCVKIVKAVPRLSGCIVLNIWVSSKIHGGYSLEAPGQEKELVLSSLNMFFCGEIRKLSVLFSLKKFALSSLRKHVYSNTVDSRYLEFQGTH